MPWRHCKERHPKCLISASCRKEEVYAVDPCCTTSEGSQEPHTDELNICEQRPYSVTLAYNPSCALAQSHVRSHQPPEQPSGKVLDEATSRHLELHPYTRIEPPSRPRIRLVARMQGIRPA